MPNVMIHKGDFVEIDYVGVVKETNEIFDLTDAAVAKEKNIFDEKAAYGPVVICVGENTIVKGVDDFLVGKDCKQYVVELQPEQAFGKKDAKLMKILPLSTFIKKNVKPFPGLQLNFDSYLGTVKTVSGGRVIVDFNHPLAGRTVVYEIKVRKILTDDQEKLKQLLKSLFRKEVNSSLQKDKVIVELDIPQNLREPLTKKVLQLIPSIKQVEFKSRANEKATDENETTQSKNEDKTPLKKPAAKSKR